MDNNLYSGALQRTWKISAMNAAGFFDSQMYQPRQSKKRSTKKGLFKEKLREVDLELKKTGREIDFNV